MKKMKRFCVIGYPINHSKSPSLHEAGFQEMGIEAEFEAVQVKAEDLEDWMKNEFPKYDGVAVTIPHKEKIRQFVDEETPAAKSIGAINTLYRENGKVIGTNTDCMGALKAIQSELLDLKEKNVLILGAGGASRAVIFALKTAEANVVILNRTLEKAAQLADEFEVNFIEELGVSEVDHLDLIVNATSVGLKAWNTPLDAKFLSPHQVVFDMVYDPLETRLLAEADEVGCRTITGDKMLVFQAIEQFKLWHGIELESQVMENAFFA
jgi:shikimate dehydrogenase